MATTAHIEAKLPFTCHILKEIVQHVADVLANSTLSPAGKMQLSFMSHLHQIHSFTHWIQR